MVVADVRLVPEECYTCARHSADDLLHDEGGRLAHLESGREELEGHDEIAAPPGTSLHIIGEAWRPIRDGWREHWRLRRQL